jgi:hypothetical protein
MRRAYADRSTNSAHTRDQEAVDTLDKNLELGPTNSYEIHDWLVNAMALKKLRQDAAAETRRREVDLRGKVPGDFDP